MAETLAPAQPAPSAHPSHYQIAPRSWSEWTALLVLLMIVAICAFGAGQASRMYEFNEAREQITKVQKENSGLRDAVQKEQDEKKGLADKLTATRNQLNDVFNSYRTVVLNSNETSLVSSGYFAVGLVGPPSNEKIAINVNGSQQTVAVGDSIDVKASSCRVEVRSFDMFKATLVTTCMPMKP